MSFLVVGRQGGESLAPCIRSLLLRRQQQQRRWQHACCCRTAMTSWTSSPQNGSEPSGAVLQRLSREDGVDDGGMSSSSMSSSSVNNNRSAARHGRQGFMKTTRSGCDRHSSSTSSFPLGNGIEAQLPASLSLFDERSAALGVGRRRRRRRSPRLENRTRNDTKEQLDGAVVLAVAGSTPAPPPSWLPEHSSPTVPNFVAAAVENNAQLQKMLDAWPDVLHRLQTVSLPFLLQPGQQTPATAPLTAASLSQACRALFRALEVVDGIRQNTGLRLESLFPAPLVVALWDALPPFYALAQRESRNRAKCLSFICRRENSNDGANAKAHLLPLSLHLSPPPSPTDVEGASASVLKDFRKTTRALALRTCDVDNMLSPAELVQVLLCVEHCDALSDDVIGPIVTRLLQRCKTSAAPLGGPQHVATNHLLSARLVASAVEAEKLPFRGEVAVAFARLLGRAQVVGHFQLHRLLHTVLLPALVPALQENAPDEASLFELTGCYIRYAVSGSAVVQLTHLWMPHIPQLTLERCADLLHVIGSGGSGGRVLAAGVKMRHSHRRAAVGAEEDYLSIVEALLSRASELCRSDLQYNATPTPTTATTTTLEGDRSLVVSAADVALSSTSLARFMCALTAVNSASWVEVYLAVATTMERRIDELSIEHIVRVTSALIRRNSHLPYHTLHCRLARRLIDDEAALSDVKVGSVALLASALMSPSLQAPSSSCIGRSAREVRVAEDGSASDGVLSTPETNRVMSVFRRHGKRLGLCSFVAGMCVAPLAQLPHPSRECVIVHFTSIATAIEVPWLVRGIVALTSKIPEAVDAISVQRWFSRFTAVDVVRQLDLEHASMLLNVLSDDDYSRNCALAKRAITVQSSRLLMQEDIAMEAIVPLALALQRANVFFPHLYSRICRVLLSNVRQAPWSLLFPAFHVAADEFTRAQYDGGGGGGGMGSVFRDVWEQLRARVIGEAATSLSVQDVVSALNGFAALDVGDRPIFSVLLHRLWIIYQEVASNSGDGGGTESSVSESSGGMGQRGNSARWADEVLSGCTPSALAVVVSMLTHMGSAEVANTFVPWLLVRLRPVVRDLYPIDVLHLMPALLTNFGMAAVRPTEMVADDGVSWLHDPINQALLHTTYDACRALFLQMYGDEATGADTNVLESQRAEWTPKVHASVSRIPRHLFVELLIALCQSGVQDAAVAKASAMRVTPRCCTRLPIVELLDLIMALCFHFPPNPDQGTEAADASHVTASASSLKDAHRPEIPSSHASSQRAPHQRFFPPALNALWERVEELQTSQVDALLRCLQHYYGEKIDTDFLERLQKHRDALAELKVQRSVRRNLRQGVLEGCVENGPCARTHSAIDRKEREDSKVESELTAEDLFAC